MRLIGTRLPNTKTIAYMITRKDFEDWVFEAIESAGGSASIIQTSKYIWEKYRSVIEPTRYLYSWQYDLRWAATSLRRQGILKDISISPKGIWEIS